MRVKRLPLAAVLVLASAVVVAGCGGSDENGNGGRATAPTTTASPPAASAALSIRMREFAFDPKDAVAKAGKVTLSTPNDGKVVHELVLIRTDTDPAKLPKKKNGRVDESKAVGEIADVEPGATKKVSFTLKPGKYAMVCALPGHYESGMYGSLTVR